MWIGFKILHLELLRNPVILLFDRLDIVQHGVDVDDEHNSKSEDADDESP
tara:strand:+ start:10610 stop:10759 length:150 start_codon:yes stop_codon:yes gene_type:complete